MAKNHVNCTIILKYRQEIKKNVIIAYCVMKKTVYLHFKDKKDWEC